MSRIIFIIIVYLIIKNENKNYINKYGKDIYLKAKKEIQEQKIVSYLIIIMKACLIIVSVFLVPGIIGGASWMLFMLITLGMASLASSESPFGHLTQFLEFDFQIIKTVVPIGLFVLLLIDIYISIRVYKRLKNNNDLTAN